MFLLQVIHQIVARGVRNNVQAEIVVEEKRPCPLAMSMTTYFTVLQVGYCNRIRKNNS